MDLHPNNESFAWRRHEGPFEIITPEQARAYDQDGGFVLENAFDRDRIGQVVAELDPIEAKTADFLRTLDGGKMFIAQADAITFSVHCVLQSTVLKEFVSGPVFRGLCRDLIGPRSRLYWDQAVYKKPEPEREFPWHQDNGYTYIEPQAYLTCWVALTDADEDNGCPWIVPGLHQRGTLLHSMTDLGWRCLEDAPTARSLPVRAGSIVVFSSLTPHRTGPNRTQSVRKSYIVQFAPDGANRIDVTAEGTRHATPQNAEDRQFLME